MHLGFDNLILLSVYFQIHLACVSCSRCAGEVPWFSSNSDNAREATELRMFSLPPRFLLMPLKQAGLPAKLGLPARLGLRCQGWKQKG